MSELLERGDPRLPSLAYTGDPEDWRRRLHEYIRLRGFRVWNDESELRGVVADVLARHPKETAAYRAGKKKLLGFFVAKVMVATRDGADPVIATRLIDELANGQPQIVPST